MLVECQTASFTHPFGKIVKFYKASFMESDPNQSNHSDNEATIYYDPVDKNINI